MNALVGYTGFVGSNIYEAGNFDVVYNSKNIEESYGTNPKLLVYAGLRAEKYLANQAPKKDMELILEAMENVKKIQPRKLVLISTIDVFKEPKNIDENSEVDTKGLHPYGKNRYQLERRVREEYPDALIIRLPGLFGKNIKKNFIYDFIHVIPFMLKQEKMEELSRQCPELKKYYQFQENGFYRLVELDTKQTALLKEKFRSLKFSALNFTDSRSSYQFYNLNRLWDDIQIALKNGIRLWHPATEPVSAGELHKYLSGEEFINHLPGNPVDYDYRTVYASLFGGSHGYIMGKGEILEEIQSFIKEVERETKC